LKVLPQLQVTSISTYLGWISGFMVFLSDCVPAPHRPKDPQL
jgi:hypothetical protein